MKLIQWILLGLLISISTASASAILKLRGKVESITETHYLLRTRKQVYYILKSAVSAKTASQLDQGRNAEFDVEVPMEAITGARAGQPRETTHLQ